METCCQQKSDFIRHFTDVDALFKILSGGIKFSKPSKAWDDKNDVYCIRQYSKHTGKNVFVLCFCSGIGNIHHWTYFGSNTAIACKGCYKTIKCNIKLNREKFAKALEQEGYQLKPVKYSTREKLVENFTDMESLPYLKRNEYCVEQELRVVVLKSKGSKAPIFKIPENCIESVNILLDNNSRSLYKRIKKELIKEFPYLGQINKIDYNGSMDSEAWKGEVNRIMDQLTK